LVQSPHTSPLAIGDHNHRNPDFRDSLIILSLADPSPRLSRGLHFVHGGRIIRYFQ
jgi:transposase InsO family protein